MNDIIKQLNNISLDDSISLLKICRKLNKQQAETDKIVDNYKKIAIISTNSCQLICQLVKGLLFKRNIVSDIYESEYNGLRMSIFDDNSGLYTFKPNYVVLLPDYRDFLSSKPNVLDSKEQILEKVKTAYSFFEKMFVKIHQMLPEAQILISNIVSPYQSPLGNLEANYLFSLSNYYKLINLELAKQRPSYSTILDMESLSEYFGKSNWFNEAAYYMNKDGISLSCIGWFCDNIARQIQALTGKTKKCLVLDLDNTLWGGVVGDDGYDGIMLDPNDAIGEAYIAFQEYIIELKKRGILLAICSKNDEKNAKEPFEKNEHMRLKLKDISCFVANWDDKVTNIRRISQKLNIGIDSFVFFDDNPTERELVKNLVPEVMVIDVPEDPALYVRTLDRAFAFDWLQITHEDLNRSQSYADNQQREELLLSYTDYNEYLKALEMIAEFKPIEQQTLPRFSQLLNKSNQFNLRTIRLSEAQINEKTLDSSYGLYTVSLKDKFSNYGIIACVILKFEDTNCFIENWVMSCRVLKKDVEKFTVFHIVEIAKQHKCNKISAEYIPTAKNGLVSNLYETIGFELINVRENNIKLYYLSNLDNFSTNYFIKENCE